MRAMQLAGVLAALCLGAASVAANAAGPGGPGLSLPPLTQPASGEHHIGKVVWADLVTPDVEGAKRFYGQLFGWAFRDVPGDPNYTVAWLDDQAVAGIYLKSIPAGEQHQPSWLTFLAVKDVKRAAKAATAQGGKVLVQPVSFPHRGRQAVLADPDGAVFAVLAAEGGDPPDYLAAPGQWIWSSVLVSDPKRETAFYHTLFGYEIFDLASDSAAHDGAAADTPGQHYVLASDDYARAGLHALPADAMKRHPHWMNFVRVTDATVAAQKAVALGGKVLVEPHPDRHGGQVAILADPTGAPFGVMEWTETDTQQEPPPP
jgi:predicted enzyme related to lactoylglutathione lyase